MAVDTHRLIESETQRRFDRVEARATDVAQAIVDARLVTLADIDAQSKTSGNRLAATEALCARHHRKELEPLPDEGRFHAAKTVLRLLTEQKSAGKARTPQDIRAELEGATPTPAPEPPVLDARAHARALIEGRVTRLHDAVDRAKAEVSRTKLAVEDASDAVVQRDIVVNREEHAKARAAYDIAKAKLRRAQKDLADHAALEEKPELLDKLADAMARGDPTALDARNAAVGKEIREHAAALAKLYRSMVDDLTRTQNAASSANLITESLGVPHAIFGVSRLEPSLIREVFTRAFVAGIDDAGERHTRVEDWLRTGTVAER